jgi:hypothetical protein
MKKPPPCGGFFICYQGVEDKGFQPGVELALVADDKKGFDCESR